MVSSGIEVKCSGGGGLSIRSSESNAVGLVALLAKHRREYLGDDSNRRLTLERKPKDKVKSIRYIKGTMHIWCYNIRDGASCMARIDLC